MLSRRDHLKFAGLAGIITALPSINTSILAAADTNGPEAAFQALVASLRRGDLDSFYGTMTDNFVMIDEDSPYRLSKTEFQDHIGFHVSGIWESFEWRPASFNTRAFGTSGIITGFATFRGKPRDAGFRIRHLMFSQTWSIVDGVWRLVLWHQSPIDGHIVGVSAS